MNPFKLRRLVFFTGISFSLVSSLAPRLGGADESSSSNFRGQLEEMPIERVLIPREGLDEKEAIEAVLTGTFPSPCYSLGGYSAEKSPDRKTIQIRQFVFHLMIGPCEGEGENSKPVSFTNTIPIGQLGASEYRFQFQTPDSGREFRSFRVEEVRAPDGQKTSYANVTAIEMNDQIPGKDGGVEVEATIVGNYSNRCEVIQTPLKVVNEGDVLVVFPQLKDPFSLSTAGCTLQDFQFKQKVSLGVLNYGTYLVHVKSGNEKPISKVFTISRN